MYHFHANTQSEELKLNHWCKHPLSVRKFRTSSGFCGRDKPPAWNFDGPTEEKRQTIGTHLNIFTKNNCNESVLLMLLTGYIKFLYSIVLQLTLIWPYLQLSDSEKFSPMNGVKPISPEQEELIHRLVYFQNEYEHPSEDDVKRIIVSVSARIPHSQYLNLLCRNSA